MASTATAFLGIIPVSQLNGEVTMPQPIITNNKMSATSLFCMKNLMLLFSIIKVIR